MIICRGRQLLFPTQIEEALDGDNRGIAPPFPVIRLRNWTGWIDARAVRNVAEPRWRTRPVRLAAATARADQKRRGHQRAKSTWAMLKQHHRSEGKAVRIIDNRPKG